MAELTVLYFAAAREQAGCAREQVPHQAGLTVGALLDALCERHLGLARLRPHLRVAVNQEFVEPQAPVPPGAEVALIPPVAGGEGRFLVVDRPLRLEDVVAAVQGQGPGAVVTFSGAVRDQTQGRQVVQLDYEAYAPMAERKLREIAQEAAARWPRTQLAIHHRVGTLRPGELAVVIAAAAPHRKEAFLACEHALERLKQDVPIWKKEHFSDGQVWVGLGP
jgi:MoaE-MoaD fusion protein